MGLRLEDRWVWDSWVVDDGDRYHLFFLQAPRSLGDPDERHTAATVGHAVSDDLVSWEVLPDALGPRVGSWDDLAIWTGSVVRTDDGRWRMFYTAISTRGHGLRDQRIGSAVSDDLLTWTRGDEQPLIADPRWYRTLPEDVTASETWRDPLVRRDPGGDGWHMFVAARSPDAGPGDDGVVAHARSSDLVTWEVGPPLTRPGCGFGQLEVLQLAEVEGQPLLVFTCHPSEMTPERAAKAQGCSTWWVAVDSPTGPWDVSVAQPFTAEPDLFAAPLVQRRDGSWAFIGFRNPQSGGGWDLEIVDPVAVGWRDGELVALDR